MLQGHQLMDESVAEVHAAAHAEANKLISNHVSLQQQVPCNLQIANCKLQIANCKLQIANLASWLTAEFAAG